MIELLLIALALSLDAFSVSISCGIKLPKEHYKKFLKISLFFGAFQALMPLAGWLLAATFLKEYLGRYAHWISFTVFTILAIKTFSDYIRDRYQEKLISCNCDGYSCLTSLSIATSIDAFVIGTVLGVQSNSMFIAVTVIGVITFINSIIGCLLGNYSLTWFKEKARLLAGFILILLAISSLLK